MYISLFTVTSNDEWHKLLSTASLITSYGISGFSILFPLTISAEN